MTAQAVSIRFKSSASGFSRLEEKSPPVPIFEVAEVTGREAMSELYEFVIELYSNDPYIDGAKLINKRAVLEIEYDGDIARYHGIVSACETEVLGLYRVTLVPQLWLAGLTRQCQIFLEKDVKTIVTDVLTENGLKLDDDFSIVLNGAHPVHEYVVQYEETDLNFVRRMMEHEGIYFWFRQSEGKEKLFIRDIKDAHVPFRGEDEVLLRGPGLPPATEVIASLKVRNQVLPSKVILKDYNYRKPSLPLSAESDAMKAGAGFTMEYGNHFKTPEEGKEIAKVRAEAILCRERVFEGFSGLRHFHPGFRFKIKSDDKYLPFEAPEFLLVRVTHSAKQKWETAGEPNRQVADITYHNAFDAIDWSVQFRPERKTPKPRLYGVMHAQIDAAGSGEYAEIDDQGRYKVKLPFDLSDASEGKASKFIRMAQPYSGADYGMHFPLHKGVEVILTHVDGDLDRPIIDSVPNPQTASPIKGANQSKSAIRTAAGNEMIIEDTAGSEQIRLFSPHANTLLTMGGPGSGFDASTDMDFTAKVGQNWKAEVKKDYDLTVVEGDRTEKMSAGSYKLDVKKDWNITVEGTKNEEIKHESEFVKVGTTFEKKIAEELSLTLGFKQEVSLAHKIEITGGMSTSIWRGAKYEDSRGPVYVYKPSEKLKTLGALWESVKSIAAMHVDVTREIRGHYKLRGMKKVETQGTELQEKFDKGKLTVDEFMQEARELMEKGDKRKAEFKELEEKANTKRAKYKLDVNNGILTVKK